VDALPAWPGSGIPRKNKAKNAAQRKTRMPPNEKHKMRRKNEN
jgi:hypothetical protein